MLTYGSVCSGIEAASVAWEPLGFKPLWFAEIEPFPSAVLAHHWPSVDNHGDMTALAEKITNNLIKCPDVLVGGTPCQAFSVAGLRQSMDDARGKLTLSYVGLANAIDKKRRSAGLGECIIVWENVPGVLSTKDNAFGCFLGVLAGESCELQPPGGKWPDAGCVFGPQRAIAWRVLDAQYFGLAQRRRRVFVVASARDGFNPAEILFEFDGVRRDFAPSRGKGEMPAGALTSSLGRRNGVPDCGSTPGQLQPIMVVHGTQDPDVRIDQAHTLGRNSGQENAVFAVRTALTSSNGWGVNKSTAYTLDGANGQAVAYAFAENSRAELRLEGGDGSRTGALSTGGGKAGQGVPMIATKMAVRRLTPTECERLQGFPDGHTLTPYRGKPSAGGPRYRALGNSMAVACMAWIGNRLLIP